MYKCQSKDFCPSCVFLQDKTSKSKQHALLNIKSSCGRSFVRKQHLYSRYQIFNISSSVLMKASFHLMENTKMFSSLDNDNSQTKRKFLLFRNRSSFNSLAKEHLTFSIKKINGRVYFDTVVLFWRVGSWQGSGTSPNFTTWWNLPLCHMTDDLITRMDKWW